MKLSNFAFFAAAVSAALSAAPAQAGYHVCWAHNSGSWGKEVMLSQIFTRPYGTYSVGINNDWYSWLKNNGYKVNGNWSCLGPYDTAQDANDARASTYSDYDANGWKIFNTNFAG